MKGITDDPEVRYMIRAKVHKTTAHSELAVRLRETIVECMDEEKECDLPGLINTVELYIDAAGSAIKDAAELLSVLKVLQIQQQNNKGATHG
jgi:hypothetical protein